MTRTKIIVLAGATVLLLATAVAVKLVLFPSIKDAYFAMNKKGLEQVPPGLVVVRPTHFASSSKRSSPQQDLISVNYKGSIRIVGRNMTFQMIMATAYSYNLARIALPPDAPKGNFDFLVTVPGDPYQRLQAAVRRKLGYTAQVETRDTPVLALKVEDPNLPGLKVSDPGERDNTDVENGRLYFTHLRLTVVTDGLEQMIKTPVIDKTGLTNFYDFSLIWNQQMQQQIMNGTLDQAAGQKILANWGLGLEPDTATLEMLVVR